MEQAPNAHWSFDCISDSLVDGGRFRAFTWEDHMSRENPAIEVETSPSGPRVVAVLERRASVHERPKTLCGDHGPEFAAKALDGIKVKPDGLNSDIHASAEYRAHLVKVMAQRAVAAAS